MLYHREAFNEGVMDFVYTNFCSADKIGPGIPDDREPLRLLNYQYSLLEIASVTEVPFEDVEANIKSSVGSGAYRLAEYVIAIERRFLEHDSLLPSLRDLIAKKSRRAA